MKTTNGILFALSFILLNVIYTHCYQSENKIRQDIEINNINKKNVTHNYDILRYVPSKRDALIQHHNNMMMIKATQSRSNSTRVDYRRGYNNTKYTFNIKNNNNKNKAIAKHKFNKKQNQHKHTVGMMQTSNVQGYRQSPTSPMHDKKFFIEYGYEYKTGRHTVPGGHHYDSQFYKKTLSSEESQHTLKRLFLSWLSFLNTQAVIELNIQSWLAHGTLIGWYWGGSILPWDDDLDVQIRDYDLDKLYKIR